MSQEGEGPQDAYGDLVAFLEAMRGYRTEVILCGGWVPFFYRRLPEISPPDHGPLFTHDFDFVVPSNLPVVEAGTLHENLLDGDFVALRNREPPVVYYQHSRWGKEQLAPVYGELLTPLVGSEVDRSGRRKGLRRIQGDLVAQQLRYLDLLLHEPLIVPSIVEGKEHLELRIPNPAAYILQKALALASRPTAKQRKDLAYVFEVAAIWFHEVDRVRGMTASLMSASHDWKVWVERGKQVILEAFGSEDEDGPVLVEQVFRGRPDGHLVNARVVAATTREFLRGCFAGG